MPKFIFDFDLDVWVRGLEIEADSYDEAEEILRTMSANELLDEGYAKQWDISEVDYSVEEDEEDEDIDDILDNYSKTGSFFKKDSKRVKDDYKDQYDTLTEKGYKVIYETSVLAVFGKAGYNSNKYYVIKKRNGKLMLTTTNKQGALDYAKDYTSRHANSSLDSKKVKDSSDNNNNQFNCKIYNLDGLNTLLVFPTIVWYANGYHYDYPDDNYDDSDYEYEVSLDKFIDFMAVDFDWYELEKQMPRFCDRDGDFDFGLVDNTLTKEEVNIILNAVIDKDKVEESIQEHAQDEYDRFDNF